MSTQAERAPATNSLINRWIHRAGFEDERDFVLRVVQPALVGMIDGTVSSLAPIFAAAFLAGSHAASRKSRTRQARDITSPNVSIPDPLLSCLVHSERFA